MERKAVPPFSPLWTLETRRSHSLPEGEDFNIRPTDSVPVGCSLTILSLCLVSRVSKSPWIMERALFTLVTCLSFRVCIRNWIEQNAAGAADESEWFLQNISETVRIQEMNEMWKSILFKRSTTITATFVLKSSSKNAKIGFLYVRYVAFWIIMDLRHVENEFHSEEQRMIWVGTSLKRS